MRTSHQPAGRRFQALLLILVLLTVYCPAAPAEEADTTVYGCVTADQVRLRQFASKSAGYWEYLPQGWVMTILGTTRAQGLLWYHVQGNLPSALNSTYEGYIQGDFFRPLTMDETAAWLFNPSQGTIPGQPMEESADEGAPADEDGAAAEEAAAVETATPVLVSAGGWMMTTVSGVNLRATPQAGADSLAVLPAGSFLAVNGTVDGWYYVGYQDLYGYVTAAYVREPSANELNAYLNGTAPEAPATEEPAAAQNSAAHPNAGNTAVVHAEGGETVTLRGMPYKTAVALAYLPNGTEVTVIEIQDDWALVIADLTTGYVLVDSLILAAEETAAEAESDLIPAVALAADDDTAVVANADTAIRSKFMAKVNVGSGTLPLLKTASATSDSLKSIPNQALLYIIEAGGSWSKTIYNGQTGYVDTRLLSFANAGSDYAPYVIVTSVKRVNIRKFARTNGAIIDHVTHDAVLPLWASPWVNDGYTWYPVTVDGKDAYIRGDTCRLLTLAEYNDGKVTPKVTPTPAPTAGPKMSNVFESLSNALNVRAAATTASKSLGKLRLHNRLTFSGTTTVNGVLWYKVVYNGTNAFVMGKFVRVLTAEEAGEGGSQPAVTPTPAPTAYPHTIPAGLSEVAYTVKNNIYVRKENTMKSRSLTKIRHGGSYMVWNGEVLPDKNGENYTWYHIEYLNIDGWIRGDLIHVMTQEEWQEAFGTPAPTPTPAPATPTPSPTPRPGSADLSDTAYTVKNNIFVRKENTMKSTSITKIYTAHSYMTVLGEILADKNGENYIWYHIRYNNRVGWIRGDLIHVMTLTEWEDEFGVEPTPAPTATPVPTATPAPGEEGQLGPYVSYESLRYGSSGAAVTRLQQALFEQGYLSASDVTGTYTDATRKAIRTFQADQGMTVDGVAGQLTQAALFRTVAYDTTLYPVEKITWAEANKLWARGAVAVITDVHTGLSFASKRYAGGQHADVEPLTAADTAIMCQIYGVSESQEIAEKNLYQRRPLWVTIAGRSLAASMYGVPHNPAGDTLPDNDYTGQFCVHFVGSKTHNTQVVDADHQAAINYAYNNAPVKK